jgi:hypothetical protein
MNAPRAIEQAITNLQFVVDTAPRIERTEWDRRAIDLMRWTIGMLHELHAQLPAAGEAACSS